MWPHEEFCARRVKIFIAAAALGDFAAAFLLLHKPNKEVQGADHAGLSTLRADEALPLSLLNGGTCMVAKGIHDQDWTFITPVLRTF